MICCVGIVTCIYLSNIGVDWSAVAVFDHKSYRHDPVPGCFHDVVIYLCTSYSQLVECRNGRITAAVNLPFSDGDSVKELESVTGSTLFIVHSRSNMVVSVDVRKNQVCAVRKPKSSSAFWFSCLGQQSCSTPGLVTACVGDCVLTGKLFWYITISLDQLSLLSLWGRQIKYCPDWLGLRWGVFTCVRWHVKR